MEKRPRRRTYIRQWRKHRGLTLERLADRLLNDDGSQILSVSMISRIETGQRPYTQDTLEALADALGTDPASLLMRDPTTEDPIWSIWEALKPEQKRQALAVIEALSKAS